VYAHLHFSQPISCFLNLYYEQGKDDDIVNKYNL
jgi:hypothetical protein